MNIRNLSSQGVLSVSITDFLNELNSYEPKLHDELIKSSSIKLLRACFTNSYGEEIRTTEWHTVINQLKKEDGNPSEVTTPLFSIINNRKCEDLKDIEIKIGDIFRISRTINEKPVKINGKITKIVWGKLVETEKGGVKIEVLSDEELEKALQTKENVTLIL